MRDGSATAVPGPPRRGRLHPALARCRLAVRAEISDLPAGSLVLAACSGGADSLALVAALAFEAPRGDRRAGVVTVDHGLQPGSAERAATVADLAGRLGVAPVEVVAVPVGSGPGGPEALARAARYRALAATAERCGAAAVLLGHTRDDQAETVLLGLARGSGARSLAGMPRRRGRYRRPFLDLPRSDTRAACAAAGLPVWEDPHNQDPRFGRARVRTDLLPALEAALGPGVPAALARSAGLLADDAAALDAWAAAVGPGLTGPDGGLSVDRLAGLPAAVRARVLRAAAVRAGAPAGRVGAVHVRGLDALVTDWHGQRSVALPGGLAGVRRCATLRFVPAGPPEPRQEP